MKKYVVLGVLALSVASFAKGNGMNNNGRMNGGRNGNAAMICPVTGTAMTRGAGRVALTPEQQKLRTQNSIAIQEKRLEVRKEMVKDNINWNTVGKLNKDIANLKADQQTQMMKFRAENAAVQAPAAN